MEDPGPPIDAAEAKDHWKKDRHREGAVRRSGQHKKGARKNRWTRTMNNISLDLLSDKAQLMQERATLLKERAKLLRDIAQLRTALLYEQQMRKHWEGAANRKRLRAVT